MTCDALCQEYLLFRGYTYTYRGGHGHGGAAEPSESADYVSWAPSPRLRLWSLATLLPLCLLVGASQLASGVQNTAHAVNASALRRRQARAREYHRSLTLEQMQAYQRLAFAKALRLFDDDDSDDDLYVDDVTAPSSRDYAPSLPGRGQMLAAASRAEAMENMATFVCDDFDDDDVTTTSMSAAAEPDHSTFCAETIENPLALALASQHCAPAPEPAPAPAPEPAPAPAPEPALLASGVSQLQPEPQPQPEPGPITKESIARSFEMFDATCAQRPHRPTDLNDAAVGSVVHVFSKSGNAWQEATVTAIEGTAPAAVAMTLKYDRAHAGNSGDSSTKTLSLSSRYLRALPDEALLQLAGACPQCPAAAHAMLPFRTPRDSFICDVCGTPKVQGTQMYGCRPCNYDLCTGCAADAVPPPTCPQGHGMAKSTSRDGGRVAPPALPAPALPAPQATKRGRSFEGKSARSAPRGVTA